MKLKKDLPFLDTQTTRVMEINDEFPRPTEDPIPDEMSDKAVSLNTSRKHIPLIFG
jgi:hypothetical protein